MEKIILISILALLLWNTIKHIDRDKKKAKEAREHMLKTAEDLVIDVAKEDPSINVDESSKSVSMVLGYLIYIAYIIFYAALGAKIQNPIFLALSVIEILTVFSHMRYIPDLSDKRVENFEGPSDLDHMLNWVLDVTYYTFAIVLLLLK